MFPVLLIATITIVIILSLIFFLVGMAVANITIEFGHNKLKAKKKKARKENKLVGHFREGVEKELVQKRRLAS
jgi:predicted membrane protein